ncbi:MAG: hypothetical protein AAFW46_14305 [Pseudomonadota bacterium]
MVEAPVVYDEKLRALILRRPVDGLRHMQRYVVTLEHERSAASHRHFFARVKQLWETLHEKHAGKPWAASSEALRKHALIATGWHDCQTITFSTRADAQTAVALLAAIGGEYRVTAVDGSLVQIWTAKSQAYAAQNAREFQQAKEDALRWIEARVEGVTA